MEESLLVFDGLQEFYNSYIVHTVDNTFRVLRTMTYGEMIIAFLLLSILFVLIFKWLWEVLI